VINLTIEDEEEDNESDEEYLPVKKYRALDERRQELME
jgi:hypothetical protein